MTRAHGLVAMVFLFTVCPLWAGMVIQLEIPGGEKPVSAFQEREVVWVDLVAVAEGLGGQVAFEGNKLRLKRHGRTALLEHKKAFFTLISPAEEKTKPQKVTLPEAPRWVNRRWVVSLRSLPVIFNRPFVYHLNRHRLREESPQLVDEKKRRIPLRFSLSRGKVWVPVVDLATALEIPIISQGTRRFKLVMPDYQILSIVIGDLWIYRNRERLRPLGEAPRMLVGAPFISLDSVPALFGFRGEWNEADETLSVPQTFGRLRQIRMPIPLLRVEGYSPQPFSLSVNQWTMYYQDPLPQYSSPHDDLYESVRDYETQFPQVSTGSSADHLAGDLRATVEGNIAGRPLSGGFTVSKIGGVVRGINGSFQAGFPGAQVNVGRESIQFSDFEDQYALTDRVILSHSSDHFGDESKNTVVDISALGGEAFYSVFLSTTALTETVKMRQRVVGGSAAWKTQRGRPLSVQAEGYYLSDSIRTVATEVNFDSYYFDSDFGLGGSSPTVSSLGASTLNREHWLSAVTVSGSPWAMLQLSGVGALSAFREADVSRSWTTDPAWRLQGIWGDSLRRLNLSHEKTGARYLSFGDPFAYQNRSITRLIPFWEGGPAGRFSGELRHELSKGNTAQDLPASHAVYGSLSDTVSQGLWLLRPSVSYLHHSLNGQWWKSDLSSTRFFGFGSLEGGLGWESLWTSEQVLYKQSYSAQAGCQWRRLDQRLSLSQKWTRNHYPMDNFNRWEYSTVIETFSEQWTSLAEYKSQPRSVFDRTRLHTLYGRLGRRLFSRYTLSIFGSWVSVNSPAHPPEVWRLGLELMALSY